VSDMAERIYIAGPYAPRNCSLHQAAQEAQRNVDRAIGAANQLIDYGHFVFVPHLSHFIHIHPSCLRDYGSWWYEEDNTFLEHWATALLYLAPSFGADNELDLAQRLGLKIFYHVSEVPDLNNPPLLQKKRVVHQPSFRRKKA
jgi:hypothetical protein